MRTFTTDDLMTLVSYADRNFAVINPSLKEAVEQVASNLGISQAFFLHSTVKPVTDKNQDILEYALRLTALNDEEAFEKLYRLFGGAAYIMNVEISKDTGHSRLMYEADEYYSYFWEQIMSLQWVNALNKDVDIQKILRIGTDGRIRRGMQALESGNSGKPAEILHTLLKRFGGNVDDILSIKYEEFKGMYPKLGHRTYEDVLGLAQKRRESSYDMMVLTSDTHVDNSKNEYLVDKRNTVTSVDEGVTQVFQQAIQYTQNIANMSEEQGDRPYANKFQSINLGYQILVDMNLNGLTEEEITVYYGNSLYAKLWEKHSLQYFTKKALEDFRENWEFYVGEDEEVRSYIQTLMRATEAAVK